MALTPQQATGKKLGSFELVKEVSASSVGATFVARTPAGENVILTKIHRHVAKSPQLCDAFLNEAKKASTLAHPNIARVLESGTLDGEPFVTHEHQDGETLAAVLRRAGPDGLPLSVAARIVLDVFAAIEAAHQAPVALGHGELGPWCVHIGSDGRARVSGFAVDRALTRFGLHFAKNLDRLPYAAPERVKAMSLTLGPAPAAPDLKADTFSAVLIAWELFTRQRLFASRMEAAVIQKVLAGAIPEPSSQRAEISQALSSAISAALLRDVANRGSLADVAAAIEGGEVASHEEVADVVSRMVERSQTRPLTGASTSAFASVRPPAGTPASMRPPIAAASLPTESNGRAHTEVGGFTPIVDRPRSAPPPPPQRGVKSRAKTLMGFSPVSPAAKAEAKPEPIEEETVEVPTVEIPKPAANGSIAALAQAITEDPTVADSDLLVEIDEPSAPPPKPPARRPPPKPRQHTLIGVEPVAPQARSLVLDPTPAPPDAAVSPPPAAAEPAPAAPAAPATAQELLAREAPTKAEQLSPISSKSTGYGVDRLGPGAIVGNPPTSYELLSVVARGGMATVWAARRQGARGIDELFAVKTMLPELSDDTDFETMFLDEMRVATRIQHENVARIHSVGGSDGVMYIAMEWVDGENLFALQQSARSSGGVPLNVLVRMAEDICAGLHAAHELTDESGASIDLVHRDVTPANVIVNRKGVAKVVDFGIAKSKGRVHVTRAGSTVKGKTPYLSPEQLGGLAIDRRSDLFSLGALLYVMATGVHPFRGESELKTIENIVLKVPAPLRTLVPDIHPEFEKLVLRLLEKDPKKRFESAAETARELERIEALLEKRASHADVANFVERVVGDVFVARERELIHALRTFDPSDPAVQAEAKKDAQISLGGPSAPGPSFDQDETVKVDAFADASILGAAQEPPPFGAESAAIAEAQPTSSTPRPSEASTAKAAAAARAIVESTPLAPVDDDAGPAKRRPMSPWLRLVMLVVVGVVVGIGVIALIEAVRGSSGTSTSATPTPTQKPTATQAAQPSVTATAQATSEPAPTQTAPPEPTATETASAPTTQPTAEPTTPPTPPAKTATAPPVKTGTVKPPSTVKPPGTGTAKKPPVKKHNPTGI